MTEEHESESHKTIIAVAVALVVSLVGAVGTVIYKHEMGMLANARHIEQLKIKDYRQHKEILRDNVAFFADAVNTLEAVLEIQENAFGPNSQLVLKARYAQLEEARERLENYVEENKHGGRDD